MNPQGCTFVMSLVPIVPLRWRFVTPRPIVSCLILRISCLFFPFFLYLSSFFNFFPFYIFTPAFLSPFYVFRFFSFAPSLFFSSSFFFFPFLFFFARPTSLTTGLKVQLRVRRKLQELTTPRSPKIDGVHPDGVVHSPFGRLERFTEVFDATPAPLGGILHDQ